MIHGQRMIRSTLIISFFTMLNFLVTFLTHVVLAARFGAKLEMDALFVALAVPTLFIGFSLSILNIVFVPVFVEYLRDSEKEGWNIAYNIILVFAIMFSGIVAIGVLFSNQLISVIVPGFSPEQAKLASHLLRIVFPALILIGLADSLSGIHYAYEQFLVPLMSLFLRNLTIVITVLLLGKVWGIDSYAYGMVFGAFLYFVLLSQIVFKKGRYRFRWNLRHPGVKKAFKMIAPLLIGGLFFRTTSLVDRYVLSSLPVGSISYLGYSSRVLTVLNAMLGRGISLTVYPKMSSYSASQDTENLKRMFSLGFRMILLLVVPVAFGLVVLRKELIGVLLERGLFDHLATINVSNTLLCHLGAIIALPLSAVIAFAFYSIQDTRTVVKVQIVGAILNIALDFLLVGRYRQLGVAFAYSANTILNMLIFLYILNRRLDGINFGKMIVSLPKMIAVSMIMVVSILSWSQLSRGVGFAEQPLLNLGLSIGLGVVVYSVGGVLFRIKEITILKDLVSGRIRALVSRSQDRNFTGNGGFRSE